MIWLTQVNVQTRRQEEQAKEAERLEPKGTQQVEGCNGALAGTTMTAGVQNGPKSPTQSSETWNVETPYFRPGALGQVKPQGTLLEVRE